MSAYIALVRKDLKGYFDQPTGYILLIIFISVSSFLFFRTIEGSEEASLRALFTTMPWILAIFVAASTMRLVAEEQRDGTLEILLTQPIRAWSVLLAKFLAGLIFVGVGILATIGIPLALQAAGDLDEGAIIAQYVGALFLTAAFVSIGLFASSLTRNQIVSFILGLAIIIVLMLAGLPIITLTIPTQAAILIQSLSPLPHFAGVARGIIALRDVLYFVAIVLTFLSAAYLMIRSKSLSHRSSQYRNLQLGVAGLVLISVLIGWFGNSIPFRMDLTEKKLYTLSPATQNLLVNLDDLVTIKLFASKDPSVQISLVSRDVSEFLDGIEAASEGNVRVLRRFPDVDDDAQLEAEQARVPPVQFSDRSEGELKVKVGWLGLGLTYGNNQEVIPFVNTLDGLEYQILSTIFRITEQDRKKVHFLLRMEDDQSGIAPFRTFRLQLTQIYDIREVPDTEDGLPDLAGVEILVVPGHSQFPSRQMKATIDEYLADGGKALFLIDPVNINPSNLTALPNNFSLADYLTRYGVSARTDVVFDVKSSEILGFPTSVGGVVPLQYFYWPRIPTVENKISGGIQSAVLPWASSMEIVSPEPGIEVEVTPLLETTESAGLDDKFEDLGPNSPRLQDVTEAELANHVMAVAITGIRCPPSEPNCQKDPDKPFRMIVAADSDWINDNVISRFPEHLPLVINWIDWLLQEDALATIRSKGASVRKLLYDSKTEQSVIQYSNIVGVPALFVLVGLGRFFIRRRTTRKVYTREG